MAKPDQPVREALGGHQQHDAADAGTTTVPRPSIGARRERGVNHEADLVDEASIEESTVERATAVHPYDTGPIPVT